MAKTQWTARVEVSTDWTWRIRPIILIEPLQDAYTEVADENDEIILIISNEWKEVPATRWTERTHI